MNRRRYPIAFLSKRHLRRLRAMEANAVSDSNTAADPIFPESKVEVESSDEMEQEAFDMDLNRGGKRRRKEKPRYLNDYEIQLSGYASSDPPTVSKRSRLLVSKVKTPEIATKLPSSLGRSAEPAVPSILETPGCSDNNAMKHSSFKSLNCNLPNSQQGKGVEAMQSSQISSVALLQELKDFIRKGLDDVKKDLKNEMKKELRAHFALQSAELKEGMEALLYQLKYKCGHAETNRNTETHKHTELMHKLPINNIEELVEFEKEISANTEYKQFLVHYLKDRSSNLLHRCLPERLITSAINKTVNEVLTLLMENSLGTKFCMKGRNLAKISFESYFPRTIDLVFEVIKSKGETTEPRLDIVTIKRSMGEWFRQAKNREGGSKPVAATDITLSIAELLSNTSDDNVKCEQSDEISD